MRRAPDLRIALALCLIFLTAQAPAPTAQKQDDHSGVISFLVASDIRQTADGSPGLIEIVDHAATLKSKPAFIVAVGNVTNSGLASEYSALDAGVKHAKELGITVYALPGSNDVSGLAEGKDRFTHTFGKMYQSFDLNSAHFILLDSTVALHSLGHLDKLELEWLDRDLKRTRLEAPIFVFLYHSVGQQSPADRPLDNEYELLSRLKGRNVAAIFCGGSGNDVMWNANGVALFSNRSARNGSVYHVSLSQLLVSVDRENLTVPGKPEHTASLATAPKSKGSQMKVVWDDPDNPYLERRRPAATLSPRAVSDNPDKEKAVYRIDSGPWKPLIKDRRDIWSETFATKEISIGIHTADILLTTSNDQRDSDELIFEVERDHLEPTRKWAIDLPDSIQSSPILAGDTVFVTCNDGKLYALNAQTGKRRWLFAAKAAIVASPILSNDVLYFGSADKTFYAVEALSGRIKWHMDTEGPILAAAACARGVVCFGTGSAVYGLDMETGVQRWNLPAAAPFESAAATDGDAFYLGDCSGTCWAFDATSGTERWHVKPAAKTLFSGISSPCVLNGSVYYAPGDGMLHCLDAVHGSETWAKQAPVGEDAILAASPEVCGTSIIVCGSGKLGTVYSFNGASGALQWHTDIGQTIEASGVRPAPNGLSLALMGVRGRCAVLNASKGNPLWGYELGPGNIFSTPAYDGSQLYTTTMDDDVQAINGPGVGK